MFSGVAKRLRARVSVCVCVVSDGSDFRRRVVVYCNSTVSVTTRVSCVRLCVEAIISHLAIAV
jgi:hypothetical protein